MDNTDYTKILLTKDGAIAFIKMNNPASLNALSGEAVAEITAALAELEADAEVRVVIITGEGKAFVAGADIANMQHFAPQQAVEFAQSFHDMYALMQHSGKVFIAAVNGYALGGGCELALACDLRIASENAKFGLPEVGLGILPGGGGTQRLPLVVGMAKAKELMLTGRTINAAEAERIGLISRVTAKEELMAEAAAIAHEILKNAPLAVSYTKKCANIGAEAGLAAGLEYEKAMFGLCFATEDQKAGMAAFLGRTEPEYKGK